MIYWPAYLLVKLIDKIFFNCKFTGVENIPKHGSYILASNHISNIDPFILGLSQWRRFSYVAKEELFKTKLGAFLLHHVGAFPIKRDASDFRALRETLRRLQGGCPVIMFPEGTRLGKPEDKKAEAGIGFIAVKSGVPVVPAFIEGSDKGLPPGAKFLRRHPIRIRIGKPTVFSQRQDYPQIANQIREAIYALK